MVKNIKKIFKFRAFRGFIIAEPLIILVTTTALVTPMLLQNKQPSPVKTCVSNQRQLATAVLMYTYENDEIYPEADDIWNSVGVRGKVLKCPSDKNRADAAYAYNANIANSSIEALKNPEEIVISADSDREDNLMTSVADVVKRHKENNVVISFADGHVKAVSEYSLNFVKFK